MTPERLQAIQKELLNHAYPLLQAEDEQGIVFDTRLPRAREFDAEGYLIGYHVQEHTLVGPPGNQITITTTYAIDVIARKM